ncbi:TPA: acyltransferase family protein, partial [Streptococcus pneumoniae]
FYDILLVKVVSVGIFLTIFSLVLNENSNKWIIFLSNQTMGIFIIHTYIMKVWEKLFGFSFMGSYLLFAIFTLSVSFIIVGMLMKIPYFNRIVKL